MKYFTSRIMLLVVIAVVLFTALYANATNYIYDSLNRLTRASYDNGSFISYTYDPAGNIVEIESSQGTAVKPGDCLRDGVVDLADVIVTLQVVSGNGQSLSSSCDVSGGGRIGLEEAIFVLQNIATPPTSTGFSNALIDGKTFFSIHENSTGGETCILEFSYEDSTSQVTAQEWLYINAENWAPGCQEEYVPNESGTFPYVINDGVLEINFNHEVWPTELVQIFADKYNVSDPDGPATWYFSRDKVNTLLSAQ